MISNVFSIIILTILGVIGNWTGVAFIIDACGFYGLTVIFGLLLGLSICMVSTICIVIATCLTAETWEEYHNEK